MASAKLYNIEYSEVILLGKLADSAVAVIGRGTALGSNLSVTSPSNTISPKAGLLDVIFQSVWTAGCSLKEAWQTYSLTHVHTQTHTHMRKVKINQVSFSMLVADLILGHFNRSIGLEV